MDTMTLPHPRCAETGMTLVELMVGGAVISLLAIGMGHLWMQADDLFFRQTLRQKAIFVLHGQTERLAALVRHGKDYSTVDNSSGYPIGHVHPDGAHRVLEDAPNGLVTTSMVDFTPTGRIFYLSSAGGNAARNVVWLDQDSKLTATLSWEKVETVSTECYLGPCEWIRVYLDYPYRFDDGVGNPMIEPTGAMAGWKETLSVMTITGRRY